MTNYQWMSTCGPAKLGSYLRRRLAGNQGCPPATLNQVFTMCHENGSCDQCWWTWLCMDRNEAEDNAYETRKVLTCWNCKWGARSDGSTPWVGCMNPKFYGAIMDANSFCSYAEPKYKLSKEQDQLEAASRALVRAGKLADDEAKEVEAYVKEERRKEELRQLKAELRRRAEKEADNGSDRKESP